MFDAFCSSLKSHMMLLVSRDSNNSTQSNKCVHCYTMIIILFHLEWLHSFFLCPFSKNDDVILIFCLPPSFFFFFCDFSLARVSQSDPVNALMHGFPVCHLAGEITSGRHERKKTMMGGHFRAKIISISSKELSLWQSRLLQFSVRPWWIPAGGTSVCKSATLKILIIDPESKSLIMTSWHTAAAECSLDNTIISRVVYKHTHNIHKNEIWCNQLEL